MHYVYGFEGKHEERSSQDFTKQFFGGIFNQEDFHAISIVGVDRRNRAYHETDLVTAFTCLEGSPVGRVSFNEAFKERGYYKDAKGERIVCDINAGVDIYVDTIFFSVEIKEHSEEGVRVKGTELEVYYSREKKWRPATSKLIPQAVTAKSFLTDQLKIRPYRVASLIYLPNITKKQLAPKISNRDLASCILYADSDFRDLIRLYILRENAFKTRSGFSIGQRDITGHKLKTNADNFFKELRPGRLEQEKLEILGRTFIDKRKTQWSKYLGERLIAFTGRAGTGKTLKLLRTANDLLQNNLDYTLILTFNRALARDLERLLKLQHIEEGHRGQVLTIDQFLYYLSIHLEIKGSYEAGPDEFMEKNADDKFTFIRKVILEELEDDTKRSKIQRQIQSEWSYLAIDEAQDWYIDERDIILSLFEPSKILIAAGVDQRLRSPNLTNWKGEATRRGINTEVINDNISLRMTNNLTTFNNFLSTRLSLDWSVKPNKELTGGSVVMFDELSREILQSFLEELISDEPGYAPVDYLILNSRSAGLSSLKLLNDMGFKYWDGVSEKDRASIPEFSQVRCVSTESCRGLEGWSCMILDIDGWFNFCINRIRGQLQEKEEGLDLFESSLTSKRVDENDIYSMPTWFMIPFTRAKKKIFIQTPKNNQLRSIFLQACDEFPAFIERR